MSISTENVVVRRHDNHADRVGRYKMARWANIGGHVVVEKGGCKGMWGFEPKNDGGRHDEQCWSKSTTGNSRMCMCTNDEIVPLDSIG